MNKLQKVVADLQNIFRKYYFLFTVNGGSYSITLGRICSEIFFIELSCVQTETNTYSTDFIWNVIDFDLLVNQRSQKDVCIVRYKMRVNKTTVHIYIYQLKCGINSPVYFDSCIRFVFLQRYSRLRGTFYFKLQNAINAFLVSRTLFVFSSEKKQLYIFIPTKYEIHTT